MAIQSVVKPKRGEVWWVNFDPAIGSEVQKNRPAVVVSNNYANQHLDRFQVVPITSNISRVYRSEVVVIIKKQPGKAAVDQISTVSKHRFGTKISKLTADEVAQLDQTIKLQLGLR